MVRLAVKSRVFVDHVEYLPFQSLDNLIVLTDVKPDLGYVLQLTKSIPKDIRNMLYIRLEKSCNYVIPSYADTDRLEIGIERDGHHEQI